MANPFRKTKSVSVEKPAAPVVMVPTAMAPSVPKGPLDCPDGACAKPINHAGPHGL